MKIRHKIQLGFLFISLLVTLLMGGLTIQLTHDVKGDLEHAVFNATAEANHAAEMLIFLQSSKLALYTMTNAKLRTLVESNNIDSAQDVIQASTVNFGQAISQFKHHLSQAKNITHESAMISEEILIVPESVKGGKERIDLLIDIEAAFHSYEKKMILFIKNMHHENASKQMDQWYSETILPHYETLLSLTRNYVINAQKDIAKGITKINASITNMIYIILSVTVALLIISGIISNIIIRKITHPIHTLIEATHKVSENRLDTHINIQTKDELNILGQAFNHMVDKLKDAYDTILHNQTIAEEASEAKTQFLAKMSHEMRTPLNGILGFSMLLSKEKRNIPDKACQYLDNIDASAKRLLETINQILDFTKLGSGTVIISEDDIELLQLVQNVYDTYSVLAQSKHLMYQFSITSRTPNYIRTDPVKLMQILSNLVVNAIKYTPDGKSVDILLDAQGDILVIEVSDTGPGIPKEKQSAVFKAFEQIDNSLTRDHEGAGLGLALVKELTRLLKGSVTLESTLGKGSRFIARIPFRPAALSHLSESNHNNLTEETFSQKQTILMVEDNSMNQLVATALFEEMGLTLHLANNGKEGIEKAIQLQPDLIFMDIHMPEMDGLEATQQLRAMPEFVSTPIIVLSADAFDEQKNRAQDIGVNDYLVKPFDLATLTPLLHKYLRKGIS